MFALWRKIWYNGYSLAEKSDCNRFSLTESVAALILQEQEKVGIDAEDGRTDFGGKI